MQRVTKLGGIRKFLNTATFEQLPNRFAYEIIILVCRTSIFKAIISRSILKQYLVTIINHIQEKIRLINLTLKVNTRT